MYFYCIEIKDIGVNRLNEIMEVISEYVNS